MRTAFIAAAALILASSMPAARADPAVGAVLAPANGVRLDAPGALEALRAANPEHYARAVGILRVAAEMPCEGLPRVIQADFQAALAQCRGALLLTSWPAQRDVSFVLGDTLYAARITLVERERITPARR
jgi:hypothetical protein